MAGPITQQVAGLLQRLTRLRKAATGTPASNAESQSSSVPVTVFGTEATADDPASELTRILDRLANSRQTVADLRAVESAMYEGPEALRALPVAVLRRALLELRFLMNGQPWTRGTRRLELAMVKRIERLVNGDEQDFARRGTGPTGFGALHTASRLPRLREEIGALISNEEGAQAIERAAGQEPATRKPT